MRGLLRTDFLFVYSFYMVPKHKAVSTEFFQASYISHLFSTNNRLYSQLLLKRGSKILVFGVFIQNIHSRYLQVS